MNKYLILVLINLPLLIIGIIDAITSYKALKNISKRKCIALVLLWIAVGVGLVFIEPLYNVLIRANLTDSPPLSLFDIVLLTIIVFCLLLIVKVNESLREVTQKVARIHERLAIVEVEDKK